MRRVTGRRIALQGSQGHPQVARDALEWLDLVSK